MAVVKGKGNRKAKNAKRNASSKVREQVASKQLSGSRVAYCSKNPSSGKARVAVRSHSHGVESSSAVYTEVVQAYSRIYNQETKDISATVKYMRAILVRTE